MFAFYINVIGIAFALACDAFSVGLALGTRSLNCWATCRLWFSFGFFQFMMPLLGWFAGNQLEKFIGAYGYWAASLLLVIIAVNMFRESFAKDDDEIEDGKDPTRGLSLLILAVATSIDALGVGVSMGMHKDPIFMPAIIIGIVAAVMTYIGVKLGGRLASHYGKRMETVGAIVLLVIAVKLLPIW